MNAGQLLDELYGHCWAVRSREAELHQQAARATGDELDAIEVERSELKARKLEP